MSSNTSSTTPIPSTPIPPVVDEGMSGGTAFCLFFFFICFVYFGGGIIVRKFLRGAEGPEIIPHYEFWNDIPNLVKVLLYYYRNAKCEIGVLKYTVHYVSGWDYVYN